MNTKYIERYSLWSAAIAGAGVMSLEISGSRIVAPYFGTGVWVWSCLISATLAGLAWGYHHAGKKASAERTEFLIPRLFFRSALYVLVVIAIFHRPLLFLFAYSGYLLGSLVSTAVFFIYPMYCLGQVLPYAVRWMKSGNEQASWRAGRVYSLSTVGSIFGTLLTGLGLATCFGVRPLIAFWVLIFLVVSAWGRRLTGKRPLYGIFWVFLFAIIDLTMSLFLPPFYYSYPPPVYSSGAYGEIMIFQGDPMVMSIDGLPQTGLPKELLKRKVSEDYFYNQRYFLPLLMRIRPEGKEALVIGLGGGLMEKVFNSMGVKCEFVEINPKVIEFAREYFKVTSPVYHSDGRWFLRKTKKKYDFIVLDVYQSDQLGWHMLTHEALELATKRLEKDGVLAVHLLSFAKSSRINNSISRTLRKSFPYVEVISTYPDSPEQLQSLFLFASRQPMSLPENVPGVAELKRFQLKLPAQKGVILKDGYFPLELAWAGIAQDWRRNFRAHEFGLYDAGILGMAIAGFMDAQIRSKVSRVKLQTRDLSQHFEKFEKDYGRLPDNQEGLKSLEKYYQQQGRTEETLKIQQLIIDPFSEHREFLFYRYSNTPDELAIIGSRGPDQDIDFLSEFIKLTEKTDQENFWYWLLGQRMNKQFIELIYDPTNGIISNGDIIYLIDQ